VSAAPSGFFIAGTDTGVGKTRVACALLDALAARGLRVAGMKPVASGAYWRDGERVNDDALELMRHASVTAPYARVNPYVFEPPIAPHIAAREAGVVIDLDRIRAAFDALSGQADIVVVEGVGGFRVPLGGTRDMADVAVLLGLPVILVVGLRLGCLNHALLSAEAIRARGLMLAGWVGNTLDAAMPRRDENVACLDEALGAPRLALWDWMAGEGRESGAGFDSQSLNLSKLELNRIL
jgi:dethiobiotin synthetase